MRTHLLTVTLLLVVSSRTSAGPDARLLSRIDAIVEEAMSREEIAGTSIGIEKDGTLLVAKGYGFADLENGVKASEHTVYRIGSITKQFTAAAILLLAEEGKLTLSDELTNFSPTTRPEATGSPSIGS